MSKASAPTTARWTRRKDARPAELLAAALDIFVEKGYAATRLDDVARRAGVSKGTLYLYYDGKESLFKAVIRTGLIPAIQRGEQVFDEHLGTMTELLEKIIFGWWESVGTSQLSGIPKLMFAEAKNFPELAEFYYQEVISRGYGLVQRVLVEGRQRGEFVEVDPRYGTRLVLAPLVFLLLWRHSFSACEPQPIDPEAFLRLHLTLVLDGLRVGPRTPVAAGSAAS
ncbi:MAG: TetR family transcriptional regulator [Betaproteobacteria bacterium]|nr:TetR family transcriptional regulator [Betaproteobacteria bacterium]